MCRLTEDSVRFFFLLGLVTVGMAFLVRIVMQAI